MSQQPPKIIPRGSAPGSQFWCNLQWRALFCLLETDNHKSVGEMAAKVGMSETEAQTALECMMQEGLVKHENGKYASTIETAVRSQLNRGREEIVDDFINIIDQITNCLMERSASDTQMTRTLLFNSNAKIVKKLQQRIQQVLEEFKMESSQADKESYDGVYAFSGVIIDVTKHDDKV